MTSNPKTPANIDEYIAGFPPEVQEILQKVRSTARKAAPEAQEAIKYGIPTLVLKGNLLSFAGYKKHIGIYPTPAGDEKFREEIAPYRTAKSTVQFPLNKPIPYELLSRLVKFRLQEHLQSVAEKGRQY